jgi:DNA-binding MarR family transcriptional regulator
VVGRKTEALPVEERVFVALVKASAKFEAGLNRLFRQFELTNATYSILKVLSEQGHEGASCGQIAERLIAEVPDMTRLLDRLERIGYVRRERSKADRRMVRVSISERGAQTVISLREPVSAYYTATLGPLGQEKLLALLALLDEARQTPGDEASAASENAALDAEL